MGRGGARRRGARQHTLARVLAKTAHQARRGASTSLNAASERHAPSRRAPPRAPPARTPHRTQPAEDDFDFRGHAGRVLRLHVLIGDVEGRQHIAARGQLRVRVRLHHPAAKSRGGSSSAPPLLSALSRALQTSWASKARPRFVSTMSGDHGGANKRQRVGEGEVGVRYEKEEDVEVLDGNARTHCPLHGRTHARTHAGTHAHARTHARTRTHTHTVVFLDIDGVLLPFDPAGDSDSECGPDTDGAHDTGCR